MSDHDAPAERDDETAAPTTDETPAQAGDDRRPRRDPRLAAAALAVMAGFAALSTGFAIVAILSGGRAEGVTGEWYVTVGFTTAVVFGPLALVAALGSHGLVQRRQWAPLLLLLGGTMVAGSGLLIVSLTVSYATTADDAPGIRLDWLFDQVDDRALWLLVVLAALYALSGTLEAASGIMGRNAAARRGPTTTRRTERTVPADGAR